MVKITVIINTYNASEHLATVLDSVKDFDEVLICDMESTDDTLDIARYYGCKIITFPRGEYSIVEPARNFAIKNATNKWVLVVDADELVPLELKEYLEKRIKSEDCPAGLYIPRKNKFMGVYLSNFVHDYQLRFFKKEGTEWPPIIHSSPKINGRIERVPKKLSNVRLIHLTDDTISQRLEKINRYSEYEIKKRESKHYGAAALIYRPFWRFFRYYFLEGDFRCGIRGFIHACMGGVDQFIIMAKIFEDKQKHLHK